MFKKNYIEVCFTTEDGIQHIRLHGYLKRNDIPVKTEQIFDKGAEDFGMFIAIVLHDDLMDIVQSKEDLFTEFEVLSKEDERWDNYNKLKDKDFIKDISDFMFSFNPDKKIDVDRFIEQANETTLNLFKKSNEFLTDYVHNTAMTANEKISDLNHLITSFEEQERYEDCALLAKIKKKIISNEEFSKESK
tara:strand:- start:837 stop:1406 length:570 start_codon:yes stop_codon:yes gene_type:complete